MHKEGIKLAIKAFGNNSVSEGPSPIDSLTDISSISTVHDRNRLLRKCTLWGFVMYTRQMEDPVKNGSTRTC